MTKNSINVVVAGATGYVGLDLVYLLSKHPPMLKILNLCAQKNLGKQINFLIKELKKNYQKLQKLTQLIGKKLIYFFCLIT